MWYFFVAKLVCAMYPAFCSGQATTVKPAPAPDCIREVGALVYRVDSVCLEQYLDNLALVARDITVRPHFENGRCVGQEIVNIGADSVFLELGLKAGDIITDANGKPLNGAAPPPDFVFVLADDLDSDFKQDRKAIMPTLRRRYGARRSGHARSPVPAAQRQ